MELFSGSYKYFCMTVVGIFIWLFWLNINYTEAENEH